MKSSVLLDIKNDYGFNFTDMAHIVGLLDVKWYHMLFHSEILNKCYEDRVKLALDWLQTEATKHNGNKVLTGINLRIVDENNKSKLDKFIDSLPPVFHENSIV